MGGGLGLALLVLRVSVFESGMFQQVQAQAEVARGNFLSLFTNPARLGKYLRILLIGVPLWFVVGILVTLAPEFGRALGLTGEVTAGLAVFWCYFGLVFGDFISGALSQVWHSRNKALQVFLVFCAALVGVYLFGIKGASPTTFYAVCFVLGMSVGFWALFVTVAAEQFGTNLRATVATTAPNFARGAVVGLVPAFKYLSGRAGRHCAGRGGAGRLHAAGGLLGREHPARELRQRPGLRGGIAAKAGSLPDSQQVLKPCVRRRTQPNLMGYPPFPMKKFSACWPFLPFGLSAQAQTTPLPPTRHAPALTPEQQPARRRCQSHLRSPEAANQQRPGRARQPQPAQKRQPQSDLKKQLHEQRKQEKRRKSSSRSSAKPPRKPRSRNTPPATWPRPKRSAPRK